MKFLLRIILPTMICFVLFCAGLNPFMGWYARTTGGIWLSPRITKLSQMHVAYAKNIGAPYGGCYLASDLGMTTDDTGNNTTLLTSFITTSLTNTGYPTNFGSTCLFINGAVKATGQLASGGWASLAGTIRLIGPGAVGFNNPSLSLTGLSGLDLTFTSGSCASAPYPTGSANSKFYATWSGSLDIDDLNIYTSNAQTSDCNTFLGTVLTATHLRNVSFIGALGSTTYKNTAINYGSGVGFDGYGTTRYNTHFLGICLAAKYDGGSGDAPNGIRAYADYYFGGDPATVTNCDIFDLFSGSAPTNDSFEGGTYQMNSAGTTRSVNAAFRLGTVEHLRIVNNGFWDASAIIIRSGNVPSHVYFDDTNFRGCCADANFWSGFNFRHGHTIPQSLLTATTGSISGAITAPGCDTATLTMAYVGIGTPMSVSPVSDPTAPGAGFTARARVVGDGTANNVVVEVCAQVSGTPTASTYQVSAVQTGN